MHRHRFQPRTAEERLTVAKALFEGRPPAVDTDGFAAACARMFAGRSPIGPDRLPLVSILICTFNRARWLREAIDSALSQDWPVEVVVVDDGSTDETAAVVASFGNRVRSLLHLENTGKPGALNTGVAALRGEAFLVLDDDDRLLPGAIRALADALFADNSAVAAHGDTIVFDDHSGLPVDWRTACRLPPAMWRQAALTTIPAMPGATLVRTAAQRQLAPFDPGLIRGQDMDHFLRLSGLGHGTTVPLPVHLYRRHDAHRGRKGAQWKKHQDPAEHRRRFLACVQPVFRRRWQESIHGRTEGFAWAVGLQERELPDEARAELARWPLPANPFERWVLGRAGLPASPRGLGAATIVIDDGAEGALAVLLASMPDTENLTVLASSPHDGLAACQLFWPGLYRVERPLTRRVGLLRLRLTSAPDWAPPPLDASCLLPLPPADAVITLAVAMGAAPPLASLLPAGAQRHPLTHLCVLAATAAPAKALGAAANVLEATPGWPPGRVLAARACRAAGLTHEADALFAQP